MTPSAKQPSVSIICKKWKVGDLVLPADVMVLSNVCVERGEVYLVSRRGGMVHGRAAATSCVAVGAPIDLGLLMVPMAAIEEPALNRLAGARPVR